MENNLEVRIGDFWSIPFTSDQDLTGADLVFAVGENINRALLLDSMTPASINSPYNSPFNSPFTSPPGMPESFAPFLLDSPATSGHVVVEPDDQIAISPGSWSYEIRAQFDNGVFTTLTYGRLIVQPSLFAWPIS